MTADVSLWVEMDSLRSRCARLAMLLSVLCWVAALGAEVIHNAVQQHAVCEHGELIEVQDAQHDVAVLTQGEAGQHQHGCLFQALNSHAVSNPGIVKLVHPVLVNEASLLASSQAPRGPPPLQFAPKTGPPAA